MKGCATQTKIMIDGGAEEAAHSQPYQKPKIHQREVEDD